MLAAVGIHSHRSWWQTAQPLPCKRKTSELSATLPLGMLLWRKHDALLRTSRHSRTTVIVVLSANQLP